ncbi:hypothetical protein PV11_03437 [Exophiala sideris]|uniref:NmrA-like domain-containing protein n=1 Tax=Exophiala sideris TaxID=1016849 RepID=A0A0D1XIA9_9EURO|nr:hypothetical protein PV11_03437 [Exophiala sideris]
MAKKILVTGATGNQGGAVVKLLLQYPEQYAVRALTRNPNSPTAKRLADRGAEVVKGDLTDPATLPAAFDGCWGAFVVTNFYDSISKGEVCCEIYEGKHRVDDFIRGINLPAAFVYTGNFYENMILRGHVRKSEDGKGLEFRQPIIHANTRLHMLWVQRDLGVIVKAILDNWDTRKKELVYQHFYAMDAIHTPTEVCSMIESVTGTPTRYVVLPNTGNESRDIMFNLYNKTGTYPGVHLPDPKVLDLGVKLHGLEEFIREDLVPHLKASGDLQA